MKGKIFNTDQVQAIQDGRMTQFMQVVKSRHESGLYQVCRNKAGELTTINSLDWDEKNCEKDVVCPFGKVGDVIYCRETWHYWDRPDMFMYKIDNPADYGFNDFNGIVWKSPVTMPREAARLFLRITNIRVMKVQEVSDIDMNKQQARLVSPPIIRTFKDTSERNRQLWEQNPYCWIIDFEKTDEP